jgi:hypothetical protein
MKQAYLLLDPLAEQDFATQRAALDSIGQEISAEKAVFLQALAADLPTLQLDNAALNHHNILPLEVLQAVTTIELDYYAHGTIDGKDRSDLLSYAAMCPAAAGEGVYTARALLSILDEELKMDYTDECVGLHKRKVARQGSILPITARVFPNPTKAQAVVSWADEEQFTTLQILSLGGKVVYTQALDDTQIQQTIDLGPLPTGTYTVRLIGEDRAHSLRLVKQ